MAEPHLVLSVSSSCNNQMTTGSAVAPVAVPSSSSSTGSPLFWVGIGVGLSAIFQVVANRLKTYALQQAFKTMMNRTAPQGGQLNSSFIGSSPSFPFPTTITLPPNPAWTPPKQVSPQQPVTVDVAPTKVESTSSSEVQDETQNEVSQSKNFGQSASPLSVDALEKMMEDPTVQKMVYPGYLPEEMRNPETFKWMMQNPQFRQQMQDMLNNMGGNNEWDNRLTDSLKNFKLNSPEVKQQFEQIGLAPEEVISKIMANPDVAMAFQNSKVQAAILDCSQNPLSIAKNQNDKEIMDVFTNISELFPGVSGYP